MSQTPPQPTTLGAGEHLEVLGYDDTFQRSMSLWANFALGFTYLSPIVGVYSLFALSLSVGGPPSIWWIFWPGTIPVSGTRRVASPECARRSTGFPTAICGPGAEIR